LDRFNRRVALTRSGRELAESLTGAFDSMDLAVRRAVGEEGDDRRLVLVGNPGLLDCWLRARLSRFRQAHPEIALELIPSDDSAHHLNERSDLALHFGQPLGAGWASERLCPCHVFPVCSPAMADRFTKPEDLMKSVLLHEASPKWWRQWF
tara:strand:+ start:703 stop:1155 length:453 start_codon:yes stop_codon:yes gene_type:complete